MRRALNAKVASIIGPTGWRCSRERNQIVRDIIDHTPAGFSPNLQHEDIVVWTLTATGSYSVQSAWDKIRSFGPRVDWVKVVWFKHYVPKWSIIQWMIILRRLSTKDRIHQWGIVFDAICCLCDIRIESHEHSFSHALVPFGSGLLFWLKVV